MSECIFCQIVKGSRPAEIVNQDDQVVVFKDVNPKAPVHFLIVPRKHLKSINDITEEDADLMGNLILVAKKMAQEQGLSEKGYRLVFNTGPDSGQIVEHLHLHLLGGNPLSGV